MWVDGRGETPIFSLLRRRTRALREVPMNLPRTWDQPEGAVVGALVPAPDMKTSRNARLCSWNFHSPRKPSVPMPNDRIGGTEAAVANRDDARRIVPSPPSVETRSTLSWKDGESVVVS